MKKKKIGIILVCVILFVFIGVKVVLNVLVNDVNSIAVLSPNLANISDGMYVGEHSVTPVRVKVEAFVTEHKITDIKLIEHENGLGSKAEKIVNDVISEQSLEVDTVLGATVRSKCILKAVENAIEN